MANLCSTKRGILNALSGKGVLSIEALERELGHSIANHTTSLALFELIKINLIKGQIWITEEGEKAIEATTLSKKNETNIDPKIVGRIFLTEGPFRFYEALIVDGRKEFNTEEMSKCVKGKNVSFHGNSIAILIEKGLLKILNRDKNRNLRKYEVYKKAVFMNTGEGKYIGLN